MTIVIEDTKLLSEHKAIAWDYDMTLVGGKLSPLWRDYVRNHPEQRHCIVTFRSKKDAELIKAELEEHHLPLSHFSGLYATDLDFWDDYFLLPNTLRRIYDYSDLQGPRGPKLLRTIAYHKLTVEHVIAVNEQVGSWKPRTAIDLGYTALVDDLDFIIEPYCADYGIEFVNSLKVYPRNQ